MPTEIHENVILFLKNVILKKLKSYNDRKSKIKTEVWLTGIYPQVSGKKNDFYWSDKIC